MERRRMIAVGANPDGAVHPEGTTVVVEAAQPNNELEEFRLFQEFQLAQQQVANNPDPSTISMPANGGDSIVNAVSQQQNSPGDEQLGPLLATAVAGTPQEEENRETLALMNESGTAGTSEKLLLPYELELLTMASGGVAEKMMEVACRVEEGEVSTDMIQITVLQDIRAGEVITLKLKKKLPFFNVLIVRHMH